MPMTIMKALRRSNNELIPSRIAISSFIDDKSQTKRVLPLEVNIAGHNHMTAFFIVDSKTEYNALLGRDWIHQTSYIPSSLYQVLIFWDGKSVVVHPTDNQPFEANMIQARYYNDHVGCITLQGFNDEGRPTQISVRKPSRLAPKLFTRIRRDSGWPTSLPILMSDTSQAKHQVAVSLTMKRLLAYWYAISKQPNSGVKLMEFLTVGDNGHVLSLDKVQPAPAEPEDSRPQVKDPLEEVNVGTANDPRPLFISTLLPQPIKFELCKLLSEFKDYFALSYHEMPGLDQTLVEHELRIKPGYKPFRQPP